MLSSYRIGIFIVLFLTAGLLFFAQPESGHAGSLFGGPPCCEIVIPDQGTFCAGGEDAVLQCNGETCQLGPAECELFEDRICTSVGGSDAFGSCRQTVSMERNIPTLGEWGLIALVTVLGAAGYIFLRRRKAAA